MDEYTSAQSVYPNISAKVLTTAAVMLSVANLAFHARQMWIGRRGSSLMAFCVLTRPMPSKVSLSLILLWQHERGGRPVCFGDYPQRLPVVCLVAAQQSKPMSHAVLILRDIGWLQFAPVPDCMTG
jgi:hypothetical protein